MTHFTGRAVKLKFRLSRDHALSCKLAPLITVLRALLTELVSYQQLARFTIIRHDSQTRIR